MLSIGGRFAYNDQGQTPNTQLTVFEFGETLLLFENCNLTDRRTDRVDNDFYFEDGSIIGGSKFVPKSGGKVADLGLTEIKRINLIWDRDLAGYVPIIRCCPSELSY